MATPPGASMLRVICAVALVSGAFLRVMPSSGYPWPGTDELVACRYLEGLGREGSGRYAAVVEAYREELLGAAPVWIPPTRVTFLGVAHGVRRLFGLEPWGALRWTACAFSLGALALGALVLARRVGGLAGGVAIALLATCPLQIYAAQRALVDSALTFFAWGAFGALLGVVGGGASVRRRIFLALWVAGLVMTKESSPFVVAALCAVAAFSWRDGGACGFGAIVAGCVLGLVPLVWISGGWERFCEIFLVYRARSYEIGYVLETGDGPLHRYVLDLMAIHPLLMLLAIGGLLGPGFLRGAGERRLAIFGLAAYAVMAPMRLALHARYAGFWELSLCALAGVQVADLAGRLRARWADLACAFCAAVVACSGVGQYWAIFVAHPTYDPVPGAILRALGILKGG